MKPEIEYRPKARIAQRIERVAPVHEAAGSIPAAIAKQNSGGTKPRQRRDDGAAPLGQKRPDASVPPKPAKAVSIAESAQPPHLPSPEVEEINALLAAYKAKEDKRKLQVNAAVKRHRDKKKEKAAAKAAGLSLKEYRVARAGK